MWCRTQPSFAPKIAAAADCRRDHQVDALVLIPYRSPPPRRRQRGDDAAASANVEAARIVLSGNSIPSSTGLFCLRAPSGAVDPVLVGAAIAGKHNAGAAGEDVWFVTR